MFALVHFTQKDEVEVVPSSWVKGTTCKWPKVASDKARRKIMKGFLVTGPHDTYRVGLFATYEEAYQKLDLIQYTSDVNTDSGTEQQKRKRARTMPQRFLEDVTEHVKQGKRKRIQPLPEESDSEADEVLPGMPPIPSNFPQSSAAVVPVDDHGSTSPLERAFPEAYGMGDDDDRAPCNENIILTPRESVGTPQGPRRTTQNVSQSVPQHKTLLPEEEFQRQVLRLLHIMRLALQQQGDLLQEVCSQNITHSRAATSPTTLVRTPFATSEDLEEFNSSLNEQKEAQLRHYGATRTYWGPLGLVWKQ
ncbi:uncharacterized protein LOC135392887 [Ornithodoros turicata]|uniref:uncharacterized protein LOC135392887 n=1 Tax=Ornithodoros turicata TaxID=34597 RepID=UPI00313938F6